MHPVRTARRAVTPRPVRQASRAVYTVTNPLGAAENAVIDAALNAGRIHRGRSAGTTRGGGRSAAASPAGGLTASELRAAEGAASHDHLAELMAVQRSRFAPAQRPEIPAPEPVDAQQITAELWLLRKAEVPFWRRRQRQEIRATVQADARVRADRRLAELQAEHAAEQRRADEWWTALIRGDAAVVTAALKAAFADNPAPVTVRAASGSDASLVVWLPGIDVLPDRKAHITTGGRLSSKAWTKTERNDVYAELLGAHLLATLRETWAVAPSLTRVRVVGIATRTATNTGGDVLFDVTSDCATGSWDDDRFGIRLLEADGGLLRTGRTREVCGYPADSIAPDLSALLRAPKPH
jgi:hypothetical protein